MGFSVCLKAAHQPGLAVFTRPGLHLQFWGFTVSGGVAWLQENFWALLSSLHLVFATGCLPASLPDAALAVAAASLNIRPIPHGSIRPGFHVISWHLPSLWVLFSASVRTYMAVAILNTTLVFISFSLLNHI